MSREDRGDGGDDLDGEREGNGTVDDEVEGVVSEERISERPADEVAAADEERWRFSVDDVGPDGITEDTSTPGPIEPGDVQLEHAVFVVAGVALAIGFILSAVL